MVQIGHLVELCELSLDFQDVTLNCLICLLKDLKLPLKGFDLPVKGFCLKGIQLETRSEQRSILKKEAARKGNL